MLKLMMIIPIVSTLFLSGCGTHYVITSKLEMRQKQESQPDIVETDTYRDEISHIKTVALKAPSRCSNLTADQRTGKAITDQQVLGTTCAVDMAEIERALTKSSYKVISWTILEREMQNNSQLNLSPLKIAEKLGAQVLFQINSLDQSYRSASNIGSNVNIIFEYYEADSNANKKDKHDFDSSDREYIRQKFFKIDNVLKQAKIQSVTLDANASLVKNAESIWFYRMTHSDYSHIYGKDVFIYCKPPMVCSLDTPSDSVNNSPDANNSKKSSESESYSTNDQPESTQDALRFELVRDVVNNMVASFAKH